LYFYCNNEVKNKIVTCMYEMYIINLWPVSRRTCNAREDHANGTRFYNCYQPAWNLMVLTELLQCKKTWRCPEYWPLAGLKMYVIFKVTYFFTVNLAFVLLQMLWCYLGRKKSMYYLTNKYYLIITISYCNFQTICQGFFFNYSSSITPYMENSSIRSMFHIDLVHKINYVYKCIWFSSLMQIWNVKQLHKY
jgi:hypothetical protein